MMPPNRRPRGAFLFPWRGASQIRSDFDDEIAFHCDMRVADLVAGGMSEAEARAQVARDRRPRRREAIRELHGRTHRARTASENEH